MTKAEKEIHTMTANLLDSMLGGGEEFFKSMFDTVAKQMGIEADTSPAVLAEYRRAMSSLADDLRAKANAS